MHMSDDRLNNEIEHGKILRDSWSGTLWYWETPAGQIRWQRRVKMLTDHLRQGMNVLELGCGVGYFTEFLARSGANIIANDISPDLLDVARQRVTAANVEFKVENAYDLTYEDSAFDSVVGSSVLHHLDVEKALKECFRVLKPGGTIYFTEPNMINPLIFLERKVPALREKMKVSPDETAFIKHKLKRQIESHSFHNVRIQHFDFLHPNTPVPLIPAVSSLGALLEKLPLIKHISGSLYIHAEK